MWRGKRRILTGSQSIFLISHYRYPIAAEAFNRRKWNGKIITKYISCIWSNVFFLLFKQSFQKQSSTQAVIEIIALRSRQKRIHIHMHAPILKSHFRLSYLLRHFAFILSAFPLLPLTRVASRINNYPYTQHKSIASWSIRGPLSAQSFSAALIKASISFMTNRREPLA